MSDTTLVSYNKVILVLRLSMYCFSDHCSIVHIKQSQQPSLAAKLSPWQTPRAGSVVVTYA